ncbi:MAG: DNA repair protein RadA, partial [Bacteroidales bacterium]|nr:DNA repair protein RadA [Bacteroidales bacterium]
MAKVKKAFFCSNCGYESPKWLGQCPSCGQWNTMVEEVVSRSEGGSSKSYAAPGVNAKPQKLSEIEADGNEERIILSSSGDGSGSLSELDRVLGGGMVKGSLVLIGGEPGIGKSTLSLQIPLSNPSLKTLYVSGEESARQIKMRAERLGGIHDGCYILPETSLDNIIDQAKAIKP